MDDEGMQACTRCILPVWLLFWLLLDSVFGRPLCFEEWHSLRFCCVALMVYMAINNLILSCEGKFDLCCECELYPCKTTNLVGKTECDTITQSHTKERSHLRVKFLRLQNQVQCNNSVTHMHKSGIVSKTEIQDSLSAQLCNLIGKKVADISLWCSNHPPYPLR